MANWKTHLATGTILSVAFLGVLLWKGWAQISIELLIAPVVVFVGTLLPDVDHHNGMLRTIVLGSGILIAIAGLKGGFLLYVGLALAAIAFITPYIFAHRGVVHSIPVAVLYGVTVLWLTSSMLLGGLAAFSFWTHLLLDKIPFKTWKH